MGKILALLSFLSIVFIGVGAIMFPNNPVFWLTSSSHTFQLVRVTLAVLLFVQLITKPPRHIWFRITAASLGIIFGVWTIRLTASYDMPFLDTLAFLSASLAVFTTSLERREQETTTYVLPGTGIAKPSI